MPMYEGSISAPLQRGTIFFICLHQQCDLSCRPSKLNIQRMGFFVTEFSECVFQYLTQSLNSINTWKRRIILHHASGFPTHFLLQQLVERHVSHSLSLRLTSGTELTAFRPCRAIHPEVQKWHQAAACARWWSLPPTLWALLARPLLQALRELQSSRHSLSITQGHQNRGYLFMNSSRNCVSIWFWISLVMDMQLSKRFHLQGLNQWCQCPVLISALASV